MRSLRLGTTRHRQLLPIDGWPPAIAVTGGHPFPAWGGQELTDGGRERLHGEQRSLAALRRAAMERGVADWPEEANVIARILAGYGELELGLALNSEMWTKRGRQSLLPNPRPSKMQPPPKHVAASPDK